MRMSGWNHRWNVLALTLLSQALIIGIQTYSFSFWIIPWAKEFSAPRSEVTLIITMSIFVSGAISPFAGIALDKLKPRMLFCVSIAAFSTGLVLISLAQSHWVVMVLYAGLLSIGVAFCGQLGCQTLVTRWFSSDRGFALGVSALGVSAGAFAIPPIITALLEFYGWRESFQILAVATLALLGPAAWIVLKRVPDTESAPTGQADQPSPPSWTTAMLLRSRDFWIIAGGFAAILIAFLPLLHSIGAFADDIGITQQRAAVGASLAAVTLALGKVSFGKLADVVAHRLLYQVAVVTMAFGIIVASLASSFLQFAAGLMIAGFAQGCYLPLLSSMIVGRFGVLAFGKIMGLATIFIQCGAIAPYLSALVRDSTGSYPMALMAMLIPIPVAMIAMRWLSDKASN